MDASGRTRGVPLRFARRGLDRKHALSHDIPTSYYEIAGESAERLAALSYGFFAVAMSLLVLDLRVPAAEAIRSGRDLKHALLRIFSAYWSIGFIVLVQLYYAISPRIGRRT